LELVYSLCTLTALGQIKPGDLVLSGQRTPTSSKRKKGILGGHGGQHSDLQWFTGL